MKKIDRMIAKTNKIIRELGEYDPREDEYRAITNHEITHLCYGCSDCNYICNRITPLNIKSHPLYQTPMVATILNPFLNEIEKLCIIDCLLANGADIDATGRLSGETALLVACQCEKTRIAEHLLGQGANAGMSNKNCLTPLMVAAYKGNAYLVSLLISQGAWVEDMILLGEEQIVCTAMDFAETAGNKEICKIFWDQGFMETPKPLAVRNR